MKKNQDASEVVFYDKYHEIQTCVGEQFRIGALKNKLCIFSIKFIYY